ncbi:penicillin acylase [Solitalea longa]|uniref:Penicillin acylase n=1 Tax=Solitalea longa TaxID=2079460 RepID=A0A2S5AAN4_9SPHI|nr:carcinine hydrolase/isopenicillin-N N-acyltransferase family protein [Solitalea longa]POY39339.1 penicillin acylase [Solitalea longa]
MKKYLIALLLLISSGIGSKACSILYFIDKSTGKIYAVNNEDYWYDVKPYIKIMPAKKDELARLWYGWDDFAQGGINQEGLFFDGAVTPDQKNTKGCKSPKGNTGNKILATCKTVEDALKFIEAKNICLTNGHLLFGDKTGNAAVVEWVNGERKIIRISGDHLMVTNFLLSDPTQGNYPCRRYEAMDQEIKRLESLAQPISFKDVGNIGAKAVQPKMVASDGKEGGTLYSTFIYISDMEFVLIYKLDNKKMTKLNLNDVFKQTNEQIIYLN